MWIQICLTVLLTSLQPLNCSPAKRNDDHSSTSSYVKFPDEVLETKSKEQSVPQQAIIAIQIINSTSTEGKKKNPKRTIESSLGYGYKTQDGKFEIYPYSQHDLPAYNPRNVHPNVNIQQAQSYVVGKSQNYVNYQHSNNYRLTYQQLQQASTNPTVTLFSTLNHGQVGALSPQVPTQFIQYPVSATNQHGHTQTVQIPVIILRIYSDQLSHSNAIYPNLPATNPYAHYVNMINLHSLLSGYAKNQPAPPGDLPISENYPADSHTQVIFPPKKAVMKHYPVHYVQQPTPIGSSQLYRIQPQKQQLAPQYHTSAAPQVAHQPIAVQQEYIYENNPNMEVQGNAYSVPVPNAPNYYNNIQRPQYHHTSVESYASQPPESTETKYVYINEQDLANRGYIYEDANTGMLMYYPIQYVQPNVQSEPSGTKYSLPDPIQHNDDNSIDGRDHKHTTTTSERRPPEQSSSSGQNYKYYNYHAIDPRNNKRTKKNKSHPHLTTKEN